MIKLAHVDLETHLPKNDKIHLTVIYPGKVKFILNYLDKIEKNEDLQHLYILSQNVEQLRHDFFSQMKIIKAAGGLVVNDIGQCLFIYRRGFWDLPKGKMDEHEKKRACAVREVMEETGLRNVKIIHKLVNTYHIYRGRSSKRRILKPTYWFLMHSQDKDLIPESAEDIEKAEWVNFNEKAFHKLQPIYGSITDVLREYLKLVG